MAGDLTQLSSLQASRVTTCSEVSSLSLPFVFREITIFLFFRLERFTSVPLPTNSSKILTTLKQLIKEKLK